MSWRRIGNAYRITDKWSTLWVRKSGGRWHLIYRDPTSLEWLTLGTYRTLTEAQSDGSTLMSGGEA